MQSEFEFDETFLSLKVLACVIPVEWLSSNARKIKGSRISHNLVWYS